jgi:hypothetical protein
MTLVTLRPNATVSNTGAITGAATAHAALSDNLDTSYVALDGGEAVRCNMTDLTLPANAVIADIQPRARLSRTVPSPDPGGLAVPALLNSALTTQYTPGIPTSFITVTGTTPTTYNAVKPSPLMTDPQLDDVVQQIAANASNPLAIIVNAYELYLDVRYVIQPVATVTLPVEASTSTTTNTPQIAWTTAFDPDGLWPYSMFEVKVFSAAQYGAGGFSPDTSTPTLTSGQTAPAPANSMGLTWPYTTPLANGTYRAYVRIATTVNGVLLWSAWDNNQFTVTVTPPNVPSIALTAQNAQGRVQIVITPSATGVSSDRYELQRTTDGGATWQQVRIHTTYATTGLPGVVTPPSAAAITLWDYEAPNGTQVGYRARASHLYTSVYAASDWTATGLVTWTSASWWLKHPVLPAMNVDLAKRVLGVGAVTRTARQGVFQALGAPLPVVVSDTRGGAQGTLIVKALTAAQRVSLDALLDLTDVLLLQAPLSHGWPDRYVKIGDQTSERIVPGKATQQASSETLAWTQVAASTDFQQGAQYP